MFESSCDLNHTQIGAFKPFFLIFLKRHVLIEMNQSRFSVNQITIFMVMVTYPVVCSASESGASIF